LARIRTADDHVDEDLYGLMMMMMIKNDSFYGDE